MLTLIAWAFSVDIWKDEVVQFNPLGTKYSTTEKSLRFVFVCICAKMITNGTSRKSIKNRVGNTIIKT